MRRLRRRILYENAMDDVTSAAGELLQAEGPSQEAAQPLGVEELFVRLSRRVYNFACWHTGDAASADDIVSAVFERVLRGLHRFDPRRSRAEDWVFAIAVNVVRDFHRARRRNRVVSLERVGELAGAAQTPEDATLQEDRLARLLTAVAHLPPRDRDVVTLKFAAGLTNEAVGTLCRLQPGHVAVIAHRAARALRDMLVAQEGEP